MAHVLDIKLIERGLEKLGKTKGGLATAMGAAWARFPKSCPGCG